METKSFKEIVDLWKIDKQQYVKRSTFAIYALIIENHLLPTFGDKTAISEQMVQDFVLDKLNNGLSQKSIKDILIVLKMILKYGAKLQLFDLQQFDIRFPTRQDNQEIEVLTRADHRRIMEYIKEHFSFESLGIYICLCAGLRIGEVCALTWEDIDTEEGTINITKTIQRIYILEQGQRHPEVIIDSPKSKNSIREIPMTKELLRIVKPLKKVVNASFYVLTNSPTPIEPRTYRNYYKKFMEDLKIPPLKFHGLRHSFATRCIESKCDYKTVSVLLGHSNISTTLNLYVHPNMDQKKRCVEQMIRHLK